MRKIFLLMLAVMCLFSEFSSAKGVMTINYKAVASLETKLQETELIWAQKERDARLQV